MTQISKRPPRPILAPLLAGCLAASGAARAADLDLAGGCATAGSASLHEEAAPRGGFDAGRLELVVPGLAGAPSLHAARLRVSTAGPAGSLPPAELERAASAAGTALLTAFAGHRDGGCPDAVLRGAVRPVARALQGGGAVDVAWSDVSMRAGEARLGARRLSLHLTGGATAGVDAVVEGAVGNSAAAVMPDALALRVTVPAAGLPALLAGSGGGPGDNPVEATIERFHATRGDTTLDGHGQVLIGADPRAGAGEGEIEALGFDALMAAAGAPGLERLHTGLLLARLVARHDGDALRWKINWRDGTLLVNNVPLPVR